MRLHFNKPPSAFKRRGHRLESKAAAAAARCPHRASSCAKNPAEIGHFDGITKALFRCSNMRDTGRMTPRLPAVLTTEEFGFLVRYDPQVVRRYIRQRRIKAHGRPARIPCRELEKFGVDLGDAGILLAEWSQTRRSGPFGAYLASAEAVSGVIVQ